MSRRRHGRPPNSEYDIWGQVLWLERLMEEQQTAMLRAGQRPNKLLARAATLLDISERTAKRRMREARQQTSIDWSQTWFGDWLRQQQQQQVEKNINVDLLALDCCGAD